MIRTLTSIILFTVISCIFAQDTYFGYRGNGYCIAHGDGIPDPKVIWKTELPSWSLSSPVMINKKVFVTSEPYGEYDFPLLICLDADSGKLLWERQIPHDVDEETRKAWHEHLVALRNLYRCRYEIRKCQNEEDKQKIMEKYGCSRSSKGSIEWKPLDESKRGTRLDVHLARKFNKGGLFFDVWHLGGLARIGYSYPTPVSDGKFIYVATGLHGFACYDFNGNLIWAKFIPGQATSNVGYGGNDYCKNTRSPLLYKNLLISDVGNFVRAIDKETGRLVWSDKNYASHGDIVTPVIIKSKGKDILLTFPMVAYLLPEGKKVNIEGWKDHGATMLVKHDEPDVVFFTGGGEHGGWTEKGKCPTPPPAAVKFTLEGEILKANILWCGVDGKYPGECHTSIVYTKGKFYHDTSGCILDAFSGKIIAGVPGKDKTKRAVPATRHLLWIMGEYVYGLNEEKGMGVLEVYTLEGKRSSSITLKEPAPDEEKRKYIIETCGGEEWGFSYGCPFSIFGNRIYVRSNGYLWCLSR